MKAALYLDKEDIKEAIIDFVIKKGYELAGGLLNKMEVSIDLKVDEGNNREQETWCSTVHYVKPRMKNKHESTRINTKNTKN